MKTKEGKLACHRRWKRFTPGGVFARTVALAAAVACASYGPTASAAEPIDEELQSFFANAPLTLGALLQDPGVNSGEAPPAPQAVEDMIDDVESRSIFSDRKTSLADGRFSLPPIEALTTDTDEIGNGKVPVGFRGGEETPMIKLPETGTDRGIPWQWMTSCWAAPNTFSHPLYFEDRMLERHGHHCHHPALQPAISGTRFVAQTLMLPYLSAINPPSDCVYTLGYYRAGNCVPALKQRPPYQRKAVISQAVGTAAAVAILQ